MDAPFANCSLHQNSLIITESTGNFFDLSLRRSVLGSKSARSYGVFLKIPYSMEQGILIDEQGILFEDQGIVRAEQGNSYRERRQREFGPLHQRPTGALAQ